MSVSEAAEGHVSIGQLLRNQCDVLSDSLKVEKAETEKLTNEIKVLNAENDTLNDENNKLFHNLEYAQKHIQQLKYAYEHQLQVLMDDNEKLERQLYKLRRPHASDSPIEVDESEELELRYYAGTKRPRRPNQGPGDCTLCLGKGSCDCQCD